MRSSTNKLDHTNYSIVTLFLLVLFHCHVSDTSFLKFRRRDQSRGTGRVILLRLPPIMIVLADDLQYIAGFKRDSSLCARYQLIFQRIIVELCSNEYLSVQKDSTISFICRIIQRDRLFFDWLLYQWSYMKSVKWHREFLTLLKNVTVTRKGRQRENKMKEK